MLASSPDTLLHQLAIKHAQATPGADRLAGLSLLVVGAGPAGLVLARQAAAQGAAVTVLEKNADPRTDDTGYTDRSFNITLEGIGRLVLGDERAWDGGIWLRGRALHRPDGQTVYGSYGEELDAHLVSIPRPRLRENLVRLAEESGARLRFDTGVTRVDPEAGVVWCRQDGQAYKLEADLVVVSDGLHSLGDALTESVSPCSLRLEPRNYVAALLRPEDSRGLSRHHIHFWHEAGSEAYAIGIPNHDGSVGLLMTSMFSDLGPDEHPFATPELAAARLKRDYPQLYAVAPELAEQLPGRRRGRFHYKLAQTFILGSRAVAVGDAVCAVPPWAGFGANSAMYEAGSLVYQLIEHAGDMPGALAAYEADVQVLARLIMDYVDAQGQFLSGPVMKNPDGRPSLLRPLVETVRQQAVVGGVAVGAAAGTGDVSKRSVPTAFETA